MPNETVEILFQFREQGAQQVNDAVAAIQRVTAGSQQASSSLLSMESATTASGKSAATSAQAFQGLANELASVSPHAGALSGGFQTLSTVLTGTVGIVAGVGAALGAAGAAAFNLAKQAGALAEQQANTAVRTGLTVKEVGLFTQVAENAGVSATGLTSSMRTLSQALSDNSDEGKKAKRALADLGIETTNQFGQQKGSSELWLSLADALGKIEDPAKRAREAISVLGRGGLELLPILNGELRRSVEEMRALGVGFDDFSAATAQRFDNALDRMSARLKAFLKDAGVQIAAATGFEDPRKTKADADQRARERDDAFELYNANRDGKTLAISPDAMRSAIGRLSPGVSVKDLEAQQEISKKTQINGLIREQATLTDQLREAEDRFAEARRKNDVDGVRRSLTEIKNLRQQIEDARKKPSDLLDRILAQYDKKDNTKLGSLDAQLAEQSRELTKAGYGPSAIASIYGKTLDDRRRLESSEFESLAGGRTVDKLLSGTGYYGYTPQDRGTFMASSAMTDGTSGAQDKAYAEGLVRSLQLQNEMRKQMFAGTVEAYVRILDLNGREYEGAAKLRDLKLSTAKNMAEAQQAELDYTVRIAEIDKQRLDRYKESAGRTWDAMRSNGGGGISSLITGQVDVLERQLFVNTSARVFQTAGGVLGQAGAASGLPQWLLEGTLFDPKNAQQKSVDRNTTSLDRLRTSVDRLSTGLGGGYATDMPGSQLFDLRGFPGVISEAGGFGGSSSGGGFLSRIFGGGTSSDTPFKLGGSGTSRFLQGLMSPMSGGLFAGLRSGSITMPDGSANTAAGLGTAWRVGNIAASGAALGMGTLGIISGIREGGAQGALTATGSALGMAAMIPGPQQPFIQAAAMITGIVKMMLGDSKANFDRQQNELLNSRRVQGPDVMSYDFDVATGGTGAGYDWRGRSRVIIQRNVTIQLNALDTQNIIDRKDDLATAVSQAMDGGHPVGVSVQKQIFGAST